jgi:hypothetical protein
LKKELKMDTPTIKWLENSISTAPNEISLNGIRNCIKWFAQMEPTDEEVLEELYKSIEDKKRFV